MFVVAAKWWKYSIDGTTAKKVQFSLHLNRFICLFSIPVCCTFWKRGKARWIEDDGTVEMIILLIDWKLFREMELNFHPQMDCNCTIFMMTLRNWTLCRWQMLNFKNSSAKLCDFWEENNLFLQILWIFRSPKVSFTSNLLLVVNFPCQKTSRAN